MIRKKDNKIDRFRKNIKRYASGGGVTYRKNRARSGVPPRKKIPGVEPFDPGTCHCAPNPYEPEECFPGHGDSSNCINGYTPFCEYDDYYNSCSCTCVPWNGTGTCYGCDGVANSGAYECTNGCIVPGQGIPCALIDCNGVSVMQGGEGAALYDNCGNCVYYLDDMCNNGCY